MLARWLGKKLKPRSINEFTITDTFDLADEIRNLSFNEDDVTALFSNVPLAEAIIILINKAFTNDCFNKTYGPAKRSVCEVS